MWWPVPLTGQPRSLACGTGPRTQIADLPHACSHKHLQKRSHWKQMAMNWQCQDWRSRLASQSKISVERRRRE